MFNQLTWPIARSNLINFGHRKSLRFYKIAIWTGHAVRMGAERNAYRILVGKPEEKRPLGTPRRRWMDNIKMDLRDIGWSVMDWIELGENMDQWRALVDTVMNVRVP
jgi:hypothetical protein